MENTNLNPDEKRLILKDYNHRINNDLQALLSFIKIQKRFGIDDDEIINFSCVSIASISAIQNLMYYSENDENLISANAFFEEFNKIISEYYAKYNIGFSNEIERDYYIHPKKMFHIMFLITDMINLSIAFSFKESSDNRINFKLEKNEENSTLIYSDNGSGFNEVISESNPQSLLFGQLIKQIDGTLESSDNNSTISIKFN